MNDLKDLYDKMMADPYSAPKRALFMEKIEVDFPTMWAVIEAARMLTKSDFFNIGDK